jgi:hypothetical protein
MTKNSDCFGLSELEEELAVIGAQILARGVLKAFFGQKTQRSFGNYTALGTGGRKTPRIFIFEQFGPGGLVSLGFESSPRSEISKSKHPRLSSQSSQAVDA